MNAAAVKINAGVVSDLASRESTGKKRETNASDVSANMRTAI